MRTPRRPKPTTLALGLLMAVAILLRYFGPSRTPDPTGGLNSASLLVQETSPEQQPSIERSKTSSTVSITLQANPARPVVYTVERWNGGARLRKLTVLYEQSLDGLESAILRSVDSGLPPQAPVLTGVDDPTWIERVRAHDDPSADPGLPGVPLAYPPGGRPLL